jgi:CTP:molybdopterin cytidylyltransferase MocA
MIGAVVLGAGASTRYGRPKQWELLPAVLERLELCELDQIVVVEGAHPFGREHGSGTGSSSRLSVVRCPDWALGPGASLRCGLRALADEVTHAVIVLADGPDLDPRAVARVLEHRGDAEVVAASYDGARSHPVVLARPVWVGVPDEGARAFDPALIDCSDLEPPGDIDVPREPVS